MDTNTLLIIVFVVLVIVFRFIVPVIRRSDTGSFMPQTVRCKWRGSLPTLRAALLSQNPFP